MQKKIGTFIQLTFPDESVSDLRGRQSVRTTFRLSERSIHALSILAAQLGIRQKSLFDYLIEDIQALQTIAEKFENFETGGRRVAKTYVVSRRSLDNLERICSSYKAPRDALVEFSIERILPLILREKEQHEKRKGYLAEMETYLRQGEALLRRAEQELGLDDAVFQQILAMVRAVAGSQAAVASYVGRGRKMESFSGVPEEEEP